MLKKCFGNDSLKKTMVYKWYERFKSGRAQTKKSHRFQSKKKAMLTVFMDYNGVVHDEFLPEGQKINKEYYLGVETFA